MDPNFAIIPDGMSYVNAFYALWSSSETAPAIYPRGDYQDEKAALSHFNNF
jgi:hypothetical protein